MRRATKRAGGQAVVELSLGLLLFVTVIIFGIHFAEVGFLSVRLQEATHAALFDSTGARTHVTFDDGTRKYDLLKATIALAGPTHTAMYQDLDGRSSKSNGTTLTQVFTQATDILVSCQKEPKINFQAKASFANICDSKIGGIECQAEAILSGYRIPKTFVDTGPGGIFKVAHYSQPPFRVCADGRVSPSGKQCRSWVAMLLDDWAFSDPTEAGECNVLDGDQCQNKPYYHVVEKLFDQYGQARGTDASNMAKVLTGSSPYDENTFWMSMRGEPSMFVEQENGGDQDPGKWVTTPGAGSPTPEYDSSYSSRSTCWLGLDC